MNFKEINLLEAFAGIGSQYKALKNISNEMGWKINHVGMVEWYVYAIMGYICIHDPNFSPKEKQMLQIKENISLTSKDVISKNSQLYKKPSYINSYINHSKNHFNNLFDINTVSYKNLPKNIDIFTYSFPCQDISVQGLQKGLNRDDNTRSGLLWQIERILIEINEEFKTEEKPKYLLMENVKNLLSKKHIKNYNTWLKKLDELGYESKTYVLDSSDFNSPQKRSRVFCISIRKDWKQKTNFVFPTFKKQKNNKCIKDILENENKEMKYLDFSNYKFSDYSISKSNIKRKSILDYTTFISESQVYDINHIGPTLTASGANSRIKIETKENKIRYMTPKECFKYMGFNDQDYENIKKSGVVPDNKIIFCSGNSISVEVLENIFKSFIF